MKFWVISFLVLVFCACKKDENSTAVNVYNLHTYLQNNQHLTHNDSNIIACAAGDSSDLKIFFYPTTGSSNFRFWQTSTTSVDPSQKSLYQEQSYELGDLFNGYLRFFQKPSQDPETWCIVTYENDTSINICQPILLKHQSKPTELNNDLLTIDKTVPTEPLFSWVDGAIAENAIYFEVVSNTTDSLISGTYTYDKQWQFYNLSNVVLNIKDVYPHPTLESNTPYRFTMMGVSQDNWVNLVFMQDFITN